LAFKKINEAIVSLHRISHKLKCSRISTEEFTLTFFSGIRFVSSRFLQNHLLGLYNQLKQLKQLKLKIMKKVFGLAAIVFALSTATFAQKKNEKNEEQKEMKSKITVPAAVKAALAKKYPEASNVTWEKEKGNYEGNWGGKSGEDHSVQFTPTGTFIEIVNAIPVSELPKNTVDYVKAHYKGAKITEAGKVTDAKGKTSYEAEVNGRDVIFDETGNFVKAEK
jgi:hypothetical protein